MQKKIRIKDYVAIKTNKKMKLIVILSFLVSVGHASFAQQSFTSKQDALTWLKEIFSKHFVKTTVYRPDDNNKTPYSYQYEIGDKRILIIKKADGQVTDTRYTVPYEDISETFILQKNDYFKSSTGIGFKPLFGDSYVVSHDIEKKRFEDNTQYSTSVGFPFEMGKGDLILASVINAIKTVARENKAIADKQKSDLALENERKKVPAVNNQKIKGTLPSYKVFTSQNELVNLYDYVEKNRAYKDKPTLLITWAHWCNICLRKIDTLLNNGLALKYNIILVNKDISETGFASLKEKIQKHSPDYSKDVILLFDRNNQLAEFDENAAPLFLWLDNKLQIVKSFAGYAIQTKTITTMLQEIQ